MVMLDCVSTPGAVLPQCMMNRPAFFGESLDTIYTRIRRGAHQPFSAAISTRERAIVRKVRLHSRCDHHHHVLRVDLARLSLPPARQSTLC